MRSRLLVTLVLAALLAGCSATSAPAPAPPPVASVEPEADPIGLALEAYRGAVAGAADVESLRYALDLVELALALDPSDPPRRAELAAAESDLLARIGGLERGEAEGPAALAVSPSPVTVTPLADATSIPAANGAARGESRPRSTSAGRSAGPVFTVATRKSFEGSGSSGRYESCIDVQILGRGGPVSGAVIGINNGDHSYQNQTDQSGYAGRCGLGASTWSVVLFWTPAGGQAQGASTTVYLSGAPEQRAAVVFQGR